MTAQPHRRSLLLGGAALAATVFAEARRPLFAQGAPAATGPFTLPPLGYATNKNEAAIDALTMEIHHMRHHGAQVAGLNAAVAGQPQVAAMPLDEILMNLSQVPEAIRVAVRNNGGGHANHSMFWQIMGGAGGEPTGALKAAIDRDLGGFEKMKADFNGNGLRVFGSGWTFVTVTPGGNLALTTKPGQDNPLMDGQRVLMGNDVWEHAYYLRYQNRRADYLVSWWNVVDWDKISERYAAAMNGTLRI
ncbi:superoxide dismutase [Humitalea sp. 24SJ18S-53]|uniref:superoxide dismutase n=1 Tax=Humitalea sp. 24SJ18S-53 TaxID=3422307 RepID=UPI003D677987